MSVASDHTALVLGGTGGLGRAAAKALAAAGSRVIVVGRDSGRAAASASELGVGHLGIAMDLRDQSSVASAIDSLLGEGIDQLVLNSGGPPPSTALALTVGAVRTGLEPLLMSQLQITAALLPSMIAGRWGRVVAIGSSGVQAPIPSLAMSNIGRAALAAYLKSLATDVATAGVTVNMVLPGRIATDRTRQLDEAAAERTGRSVTEVAATSAQRIPLGRYGDPDEFGAAVAFLAGPGAAYITGEQLRVDGGLVSAY